MNIDQIKQLQPGASFTFNTGTTATQLTVKSNDGFTLVGNVVGGPRDGTQISWCLEGLDQIPGIS